MQPPGRDGLPGLPAYVKTEPEEEGMEVGIDGVVYTPQRA